MDIEVNIRELAAHVRAKRGTRGLRAVAQEIGGVSASTLSRVEQGKVPDLDTFARLCRWLGVSPNQFMPTMPAPTEGGALAAPPGLSTPEVISAHLRADRTLTPETADALATMIRLAYEAVSGGQLQHIGQMRQPSATRVQDMG